jgi:hypothetical protein
LHFTGIWIDKISKIGKIRERILKLMGFGTLGGMRSRNKYGFPKISIWHWKSGCGKLN